MSALLSAALALALVQAEPSPAPPAPSPAAPGGASPGTAAPAPSVPIDAPEEAEPAPPRIADPALRTRHYQVEKITFLGLKHTREAEVRRHVLVEEGEPLVQERVLLSRLRLLQLGWFSRVEARVERGSQRGLVVLVFDVAERNTIVVTDLIIGSTGPQPFYGGLGLSQQNFLGRGFGLSGAFAYGGAPAGRADDPDRFAARASFFAPDVRMPGGARLVLGANALFLRGEEFTCSDPECEAYRDDYGAAPRVRYERAGGELSIGVRPGPFERLVGTYRGEHLWSRGIGDAAPERDDLPFIRDGGSFLSALVGTYEIDTRDDFFLPSEGFRGVGQITFASRALGGDYEYSRYLVQVETAFGVGRLPLRLQAALGAAQGEAPFFERFYPADYSYFAIGPALGRALELNFSTDSRYDAFLAMGGAEYAAKLWARGGFFRRAYLALGVRGVWSNGRLGGTRTSYSASPASADVALRLDTPVGVFNLSLGYAVDIFW
jgi:outer membrane protein assembly factor BamA